MPENSIPPTRPTIVSPDTHRVRRIPPGQSETRKWPVLHYGSVPHVDTSAWTLRMFGLVKQEKQFTFQQFSALPSVNVQCDIHCVTRWSRLNNTFSGPSTRTVAARVDILPAAKFVLLHCEQGFTTNLPLDAFLSEDALFALYHDNAPLTPEHGYPVRLVVPRLYFWKSAKWVRGVEFLAEDIPGFWEQNGYHMHGDPWDEERFSF